MPCTLSFDVGIKNLAFCIINEENKILKWDVHEIALNSKHSTCESIIYHLDKHPYLLNVDIVLIEKQPSRNNKMRIIESLLNAYFVIKGLSNNESSIKQVKVYSAKYKLSSNTLKGKQNYSHRKQLSILRTKKFLDLTSDINTDLISLFSSSKKKDDLADSLLQALSFQNSSTFHELENLDCTDNIQIKIVSRKPTAKQEKSGYSLSNMKYLLLQNTETQFENLHPKLQKSLIKFFGNNNTLHIALQSLQVFT